MPRNIETTVYTFDELNDRAKEHARDWYRESSGQDFADFGAESVLEDATRICALFGLDISTKPVRLVNGSTRMDPNVHWCVADRSAGATYAGSYRFAPGSVRKVESEAPSTWTNTDGTTTTSKSNTEINQIVRELNAIQRRNFYQITASIDHGRQRDPYPGGMSIEVERTDGKNISDTDNADVIELLQDVAHWIHASLELEFEYQQSNETVDENIRCNEYTFTEDGEREG